ncbi:uncharacterized protein LOC130670466 [Microplitis mediator]|uniref:uncharacterized protein LOC130670466 n=1 Tax=Microplitis mediator TaxID=375433 RepID=UPI002555BB95|nr:uncharacterized protein LOC130670466 [Microplitis mediator]
MNNINSCKRRFANSFRVQKHRVLKKLKRSEESDSENSTAYYISDDDISEVIISKAEGINNKRDNVREADEQTFIQKELSENIENAINEIEVVPELFNVECELVTSDDENYSTYQDSDNTVMNNSLNQAVTEDEATDLEKLSQWALESQINHEALTKLLKIVQQHWQPNAPKCAKTLLTTAQAKYHIIEMTDKDESKGEFVYIGLEHQLKRNVVVHTDTSKNIELLINIDGVKLFKSSLKCFWPILGMVYSNSIQSEPFVIAIYAGTSKPNSSNEYLNPFIREINGLLRNGVEIDGQNFKVCLKGFICDTPARAFIKGIVSHTSFNACERCMAIGRKKNKTTIYPSVDSELYSDRTFRNFMNIDHHVSVSPLIGIKPPIDMIHTFILDFMHLGFLGVMKKISEFLLGEIKNKGKLDNSSKNELSRRLIMLKQHIPEEFPRKCRPLGDFTRYKATEFKLIALYLGIILFKKILDKKKYHHFLLFCVGSRLLWSKVTAVSYNETANQYFNEFVTKLPNFYGEKAIVLNMHHLKHVAKDVKFTGYSLSEINAFPFENFLMKIKHWIRSPHLPLQQFCRRLHEQSSIQQQKKSSSASTVILKTKKNKTDILNCNTRIQYSQPKNQIMSCCYVINKLCK